MQRYLTWFHTADQAASTGITLHHLLNHLNGLPRDFEAAEAESLDQDANGLETRLRGLSTVELEQPIGTYGYSNIGCQQIFVPLAMQQSFATLSEAAQHDMAAGHHYWFGMPVAARLPAYRTGPGNGGLFSSAEDMAHYLMMHLNQGAFQGATLLSPSSIAELHRPAVPRPDGAYAMGWNVQTIDGVTRLVHSGQTYNYMAKMILVPDSQWGIVVLQNAQYTVKLLTGDYSQDTIADGVASILSGEQLPSRPANFFPLLAYGILFLLISVQLTAIVRSSMMLRRWQKLPEQRPLGKLKLVWHAALPLSLNLGWAILALIGLPATNNLTKLADQAPDFTYTLLASGMIALSWGIIRTIWVSRILYRPNVAHNDGLPVALDTVN